MKKRVTLLMTGILILSLGGCAKNAESLSGKVTETQIYTDESDLSGDSATADEKVSDEAKKGQTKSEKAGKDQSAAEKTGKDESAAEKTGKDQSAAEKAGKDQSSAEKGSDKAGTEKTGKEPKSSDQNGIDRAADGNKESDGDITGKKTSRKVYQQEHFGFRLVLDEDWEFASEKEIEEQNRQVAEEAGDEASFAKIVENGNFYTDMMANNTMTGNSIIVRLVQVGLADVIGSAEKRSEELSEALYAEAEAAGLKKIKKTTTEAEFLGEPVTALGVKGELALSDEYKTEMWYQMIMKRKGEYAAVIFVSGFTEFGGDNFQEILDRFEAI